MNRRGFLGFLGVAAAAGPQGARSAASMSLGDLAVPTTGLSFPTSTSSGAISSAPYDHKVWAAGQLKALLGLSNGQRERDRRNWSVSGLEPEIASLRSVALHTKIRMTRDRQYERDQMRQRDYLEGVVSGLWG